MFPTRNGTGVVFIPAYIDHGSTSGQSNIMLEFFIKCRGAQNIPVTGPMLQAKAAEIASSLQIEKFSASNG